MKIESYHLGFVGFGQMGQIIFRALDAARLIPRSQILFYRRDPGKAKQNEQQFGLSSTTLSHLVKVSNLIVICVPSKQAEFVLPDLVKEGAASKMILSVMGGIKISFIQKYLGPQASIARLEPNIASSISEGVNLISFGSHPSLEFRSLVNLLSGALGQAIEIPESQMDVASSITHSGSAFAIELIELMARLGEKEGLAYTKAIMMAAQTFSGAAHLIMKGKTPEELLNQMAASGSPVAIGDERLRFRSVAKLFQEALQSSTNRSHQISEEFF
jgi:pyrroline-5-carboxylate reductase